MNAVRRYAPLAAILPTLLLAALPLVSMAQQQRDPPGPPHQSRGHEDMQQNLQRHLDHLAARLEIRASQQEAWNAFTTAVRAMVPDKPHERPAESLDAASRARMAADRAAERAKHLTQLADATAKLQQVLDPPQKEVLNEVARHFGSRLMAHGDGMHGMHEGHCDEPMHEGHHFQWHERSGSDGHDGHDS
jgi:LTXXQ motif family protein